ncbi:MAG TPA: glycosyl transferase [Deltaproteobacteria bacterium]|nr:glycosyl transferase [Deltaproteobacteria bacterium]HCP44682.1 glycosyl transferase [Deltaproteobacteria bacterium]
MSLLIIQIPCLNEEATLPATLRDLPSSIEGIDRIEILIIDDGSSDRTIEVAREHGVHHLVRFPRNRGLAAAFRAGIDACLRLGADYIVNTDGDNQYSGASIAALVEPVVSGGADVAIGDRKTSDIAHFSWTKKRLQTLGSWVVRQFSGTLVPDATSGFRCWSRHAAMRLNLVNRYTYTLESIIQAGHAGMQIESVPIGTNEKLRESRLIKSIRTYVSRSAVTILRSYLLYRPFRTFFTLGSVSFASGLAIGVRFLWLYAQGEGSGHVQSVVLSGVLLIVGVQLGMIALLADLVAANRKLTEEGLVRLRRIEAGSSQLESDRPSTVLNAPPVG